jgi:DNA-binding transcriptional LysR family regulator
MRHLRLVSVLAQELNLSRTAELLNTSQPALSRSLAQLEDFLQQKLFNRTTKRVSLTAAGIVVVQHANRALAELELIRENLAGIQSGTRAEVRIGTLSVFSNELLSKAIVHAQHVTPQVVFSVELLRVQECYEALLDGRIDLMLSHTEFEFDLNTVSVTELYQEQSCVMMAANHPLSKHRHLSRDAMAQYPWVLPTPETPLRRQINKLLSVHRLQKNQTLRDVQTDSLLVASSLVKDSNLLWAVASRIGHHLSKSGENMTVAQVDPPLLSGPMCAFHIRNIQMSSATKLFLSCLNEAIATVMQSTRDT